MKTISKILTALFLLGFFIPNINAQEEKKGQLWYCWEATINPAMENEFIRLLAEEKAYFEETNDHLPYYVWKDLKFHYYIFIPMNSYDDVNPMIQGVKVLFKKWGEEKTNELWKTIESHRIYFIRHVPEISYTPETPRLNQDEGNFAIWDIFYFKSEKKKECYQLMKDYSALLEDIKYSDPFQCYSGDIGFGGSILIVALKGKSPQDFWTQNAKMGGAVGEKGQRLFQQMVQLINKRDQKEFWYLKDLSYEPESN